MSIRKKLEKLQWMMENLPEEPEKRNRWLGFIHGTLHSFNLCTIDELRQSVIDNKTEEFITEILNPILSEKASTELGFISNIFEDLSKLTVKELGKVYRFIRCEIISGWKRKEFEHFRANDTKYKNDIKKGQDN